MRYLHFDRRRVHCSLRGWRPAQHAKREIAVDRRHHVALGALIQPPRMPEIPRFQVRVLESPLGHLLDHPVGGVLEVGRTGQPRPVAVGEHVQRVHGLRMLQLFGLDPGVGGVIQLDLAARGQARKARVNSLWFMLEQVYHVFDSCGWLYAKYPQLAASRSPEKLPVFFFLAAPPLHAPYWNWRQTAV